MNTAYTKTAFDEIIDRFGDKPRCEGSGRCTRPARWRINLHGCEQAIMCGQHKSAWLRQIRAKSAARQPRCAHCGQVFSDIATAVSVVAI
jgi:hypothetical protein